MNATPAQIAAAVYQACTTYDQYLPQLSPDVARSWSKVFLYYNLSVEDLLEGVDKVYTERGAGYRPLPADIAQAAKAIRSDRAQREGWPELEARQEAFNRKAADETQTIARAAAPGGPLKATKRLEVAKEQLQECRGKKESRVAIKEYLEALGEARKPKKQKKART